MACCYSWRECRGALHSDNNAHPFWERSGGGKPWVYLQCVAARNLQPGQCRSNLLFHEGQAMNGIALSSEPVAVTGTLTLPDTFLTCYAIKDPTQLSWPVRIYKVKRTDDQAQTHED